MNIHTVKELIYLISAILFILSLMWMSHPSTARRGVFAGVVVAFLAAAPPSHRAVRWCSRPSLFGLLRTGQVR